MYKEINEIQEAKYKLLGLSVICGECVHFKRFQKFKENYDSTCNLHEIEIDYFQKSCNLFKSEDYEIRI